MIELNQESCRDLDVALTCEWLETNGIGGFSSSTIVGLNTRRYHGLLTAATKPPVGRFVLLSKLEETLLIDGRRHELSSNQYPGVIHPQGFNDEFPTYPVVDNDDAFIGFVTEARLRRTVAEGGAAQTVSALVQSSPHVQPDDTLVRAVVKMESSGSRQLAVVEPGDGKRLMGMLTMSDVVRAHAKAAIDADDCDRPELPALSGPTLLKEK